jgi:rare lipoprotein A
MRIILAFLILCMGVGYSEAAISKKGSGYASFYSKPQKVACGGRFNPNALTAAHKTLPCGSKVVVTNKRNGKSVTVTINDRGPFIKGRVIDLSKRAASVIGMINAGVVPVTIKRI